MATTRTYFDTCVYINAFRNNDTIGALSRRALTDGNRHGPCSLFLHLELLPKPTYYKKSHEVEFMKTALGSFELVEIGDQKAAKEAIRIAELHGLSAMDALHLAAAIRGGAAEFLTTEAQSKPRWRVKIDGLRVVSLNVAPQP